MPLNARLRRFAVLTLVAVAAIAVTAYVGVAALLYSKQDTIIFRPNTRIIYDPTAPAGMQRLTLKAPSLTGDGPELQGILLAPARKTAARPTLLLAFGGNGQDAGTFGLFLRNAVFPDADVTIAVFNYRGYSSRVMPASGGTPSQANLYADALQQYDALQKNLRPARTVLVGYSLGTSMATYVASRRNSGDDAVDGLTLIAPFTSILSIGQGRYPWLPIAWLLRNPFPTSTFIADVTAPTSIFYAPNDRLIPPAQPQDLAQTLSRTEHLREISAIPGTGHVSILENPATIQALRRVIAP